VTYFFLKESLLYKFAHHKTFSTHKNCSYLWGYHVFDVSTLCSVQIRVSISIFSNSFHCVKICKILSSNFCEKCSHHLQSHCCAIEHLNPLRTARNMTSKQRYQGETKSASKPLFVHASLSLVRELRQRKHTGMYVAG
jgi:hypothetical protein